MTMFVSRNLSQFLKFNRKKPFRITNKQPCSSILSIKSVQDNKQATVFFDTVYIGRR